MTCNREYNEAMLDASRLQDRLPIGRFGLPLHVFQTIDSTNRYAAELAERGEPEGTLILADEQTQGKGRGGRRWLSPAGGSLAFSVILRPNQLSLRFPGSIGILGALAVVEGLGESGEGAEIKWPNDVLINRRKVAGVLAEAAWQGESLQHIILGIGINVHKDSRPTKQQVDFPATAVELEQGGTSDRIDLLCRCLQALDAWYPHVGTPAMVQAWEHRLAYKGELVEVVGEEGRFAGIVQGITDEGFLRIENERGELMNLDAAGCRLRPVDTLRD